MAAKQKTILGGTKFSMFLNFFDVISIFIQCFFDVLFLCSVFLCFVFPMFLVFNVLSFYFLSQIRFINTP